MKRLTLLLSATLMLSSCGDRSLVMWHEDDKPAYAQGSVGSARADARAPLDVPPELRSEMELPDGSRVAGKADEAVLPKEYQQAVAGKAISLDARIYQQSPAAVFSAAVDAMTSLNVPVESVDSPSGIVTSDWIRKGENNPGLAAMIGFGGGATMTRHRFIVRVYRARLESGDATKLEIRVLGQAFENRHWVNRPLKRKVSEELFTAVDEQLTRMQRPSANP